MTFTPVNESSSTATAIKETALHSTITVKKAGNRSTLIDQALATTIRYRKAISPTMVTPDTADSTKSPPAKSPTAKLSSIKSSPTELFPTMDFILVTSKTMDHIPATLPFQALKSLCDSFFPDRHFDSIQEAVEIAVKELTLQDQLKFMHSIYELFADTYEVSNAQVAWLSEFEENNAGWRELGYKRYYDYLRTIDSSGRAYVFRIIKLGQKPKVNRWYTSADFKEAKALLEKGCPIVNEEINLDKMGLKLYQGLVILVAYYPCEENQSRTRILSLSAPPPNCQIPSASPVLISSARPTEKDSSPEISDIPETTVDDVTKDVNNVVEVIDNIAKVIDDVTEVVDEHDEATSSDNESSDNESSETAITPTPIRTKASCKRKRAG
ncbi:hypothetical protein K440DRAFT_642019 [Wilcoxina mikolae CBS 423.85]|nr:hypothetical protein K440DRAFT_642019 [Wilcoxina mikolae CBS 423.85]